VVLNAARAPISSNAVPEHLATASQRAHEQPRRRQTPADSADSLREPQTFLKVVGEFHCRLAIRILELALQTYRIEVAAVLRVAVAKSSVSSVPQPALKRSLQQKELPLR
jgi:hypothetical protein